MEKLVSLAILTIFAFTNCTNNSKKTSIINVVEKVQWECPLYTINELGDTIEKNIYDDKGRLTTHINTEFGSEIEKTVYEYDEDGYLLKETQSDHSIEYFYTQDDNKIDQIIAKNHKFLDSGYVYKSQKQINQTLTTYFNTNSDKVYITQYTYDESNRLNCITDYKTGKKIKHTYNNDGRLEKIENGETITTFEYDEQNKTIKVFSDNWSEEIDSLGRIKSYTIGAYEKISEYEYFDNYSICTTIDTKMASECGASADETATRNTTYYLER